jgi:hypothetical protein
VSLKRNNALFSATIKPSQVGAFQRSDEILVASGITLAFSEFATKR